jgi:hypothetical protein
MLNEGAVTQTNLKVFQRIGLPRRAQRRAIREVDSHACGIALRAGSFEVYNEEAFQYLLDLERKRSLISNRPFMVLLVEFDRHPGAAPADIDPASAGRIFSILAQCLRETDFIGWYEDSRIAGAVLTQHGETNWDEISNAVRQRVGEALQKHFPPNRAHALHMRVFPL